MDPALMESFRYAINLVASILLFGVSQGKRCGYRLYSNDDWTSSTGHKHHGPSEIAMKECTWGCCWNQKNDVCCSFPMELAVVALVSILSFIIVVAVIVTLIRYLLARRKRACEQGTVFVSRPSIIRNFSSLIYPCPSTLLQNNYERVYPELTHAGPAASSAQGPLNSVET